MALLDPALEQRLATPSDAAAREVAFSEMVRALRQPLFALCLNLLHHRAEAEDALQETFLSVHRALPRFRGEAALSTWIWRIAIRSALSVRARRTPTDPLDDRLPAPNPGDPAERSEDRARLQKALDALPSEQRVVLSLFAVQCLSHKDIAEMLSIAEGTVWSRLHLAKKRLAKALQ